MKIYCFSKNKFKNLILSLFIYLRKKFKIKKNKNSKNNDKGLKYEYEDVELVIGDCGSGKSVYLVSQAMKYLKMGFPVYSTTPIQNCKIITINDLMPIHCKKFDHIRTTVFFSQFTSCTKPH